ncbi:hypothetical protein TRFO_04785 [Tritrichomonas foetus]|uniref:Dynein regulatory complex protein 1 C-terminal domain-containing protein n=1 Tax=Tritrichomonas foetus TaxID=1144522 RepID=A0A1J4KH92_9EUKA|nr:hypothetical protein TRFO_04785 [Tritrichomonas foetus]|eukprot:OHT08709.1 hypothetical protein TRFO_04785 [Tritrichomonas foetus]
MTSVLTKEYDERAPVKQMVNSRKEVNEMIARNRNELTGIFQRQLAIEQERAYQVKETRKQFDEEYTKIESKVTKGITKLNDGWKNLLNANLPLEFEEMLQNQKEEADDVVNKKLAFIKELEYEVMRRDHEYVNKIAAQNAQIDTFVHQMRNQENELREKIAAELRSVLSSYVQEKTAQTIQVEKEVKQLTAKRQEREQTLMKQLSQNAKDQRDSLEALRQNFAQEYMTLRTSHETKLEVAQKEYQDRLAQMSFSIEQLEYDYRILQENEEEHQEKLKMQAKKLVRQRDCLRALKHRYNEEDARFERQNAEITKDYKRIAQSYRELQLRFRNVAYTDFNAFREVWNLNEKRLHDQVLKILEADRVIMEQQLGKDPRAIDPEYLKRWIIGTEEFEDLTKTPQAPVPLSKDDKAVEKGTGILSSAALSEPLEHLRRMITDEVGFLVDERVRNIIGMEVEHANDDTKETIRLDVLLQDLGITEPDDVEQLLSHFIRDTEFGELETPGFVRPHEVLDGLRNFVEAYHPNRQQNQMSLFSQITSDATQNTSSEVARAIIQLQTKMKKQMVPQRKFWEKKAGVVTEEMWRLWNATFKGMQRYKIELEERAKLITDTERLKIQNSELEMLLSQYLQSENNDQLIYAPGETVDFQVFD